MFEHNYWRVIIRRALQTILPTASEFDAFCLDNFPEVYQCFSDGMDRIARTTCLLAKIQKPINILNALHRHNPHVIDDFLSGLRTNSRHESSTADDSEGTIEIDFPEIYPNPIFKIGFYCTAREFLEDISLVSSQRLDPKFYGVTWFLAKKTKTDFWPVFLSWKNFNLFMRGADNLERRTLFNDKLSEFGMVPGGEWIVLSPIEWSCFGVVASEKEFLNKMCNSLSMLYDLMQKNFVRNISQEDLDDFYAYRTIVCGPRKFMGNLDRTIFAEIDLLKEVRFRRRALSR